MTRYFYHISHVFLITLLFSLIPQASHATMSEWQSAKARLEQYADNNQCEKYWDVLWPWAKSGNLEARAWLFFLMAPPPDMGGLYPPGNSGDLVSKIYDMTVMAVHSEGSPADEQRRSVANKLYATVGFDQTPKGQEFLKCVSEVKNNCADLAVAANLVPSFQNYALRIDNLLAKGMKSSCEHSNKFK